VVLGAILTQNTKWKTVEKVLERIKDDIELNLNFFLEKDENYFYNLFKGINFRRRKIQTIKEF